MHNMPEMTEEEKKQIFKIVSENDYKKFLNNKKYDAKAVVDAFHKANMKSVPFGNFRSYCRDHIYDADDPFVSTYLELIRSKIVKEFSSWDTFSSVIDNREYKRLSKEDLDKLEEFREEYEKTNLPLSFERMIIYSCMTPISLYRKVIEEKYKDTVRQLQESLTEEQNNHIETKRQLDEATRNERALERQLEQNNKKIEKYESMLSTDKVVMKLAELLGIKEVNPDPKILIDSLNKLEVGCLNRQDYNRYMEILAAKYAIAKVLKEDL